MRVAALFTRKRSSYLAIPGVDCFDASRDALTFGLDCPVVAHPPCRAWGKLAQFAKPRPGERDLAHWAVHVVRFCGGVLEHPLSSRLWREIGCGSFGVRDQFGGVLVPVRQSAYGHLAQKDTGLYIVGPVPELAFPDAPALRLIESMCRASREATPPEFGVFLVNTARACA